MSECSWFYDIFISHFVTLFLIHSCAGGDHDILFLHNENPLLLEGCQSNGLCKLSMLLERLNRYLDVNCSEIFCSNS